MRDLLFLLSSMICLLRSSRSFAPRRVVVEQHQGQRALSSSSRALEAFRTTTTLEPVPPNLHRVVLMRHGESEFNNANVFTGWCDVALTQRGVVEAMEAGQVFASHGQTFRKCYASVLTRSIVTAHRALEAAGISYTPIEYDWRLNERHYGALQGLSKERTADRLGKARVMKWRRSYEARPPIMTEEHPHYNIIHTDARYQDLERIPLGESLEDTQIRCVEAWNNILDDISTAGASSSLLVAHANTLRALVMHLDDIPADQIEGLNIPTAIPFYYDIDIESGKVVNADNYEDDFVKVKDKDALGNFRGVYISDERKKRSFLERRRAANDPWLWALHDHQVGREMLVPEQKEGAAEDEPEGLNGIEEEAARNTELFSSALKKMTKDQEKVIQPEPSLDSIVNGQ
uniref:Phosphoglycerate mutase n=1 Tax=Grammatophora oceanica TaxID=210454 RepID=A0A7S1Y2D5_9STRA|mmetsp:Transcript_17904/g.26556  ORF Transcript_17904/g.26556 Transcript_17904/m.26556 type:complete len:403 (+) Transcript_17904:122-1330(+)|eukprot:CAMPEP_0194046964 /NCGR_PEP_ID=MMETSP0009_2-20130614/23177_1 /TAXON_ID=210454 /ORGANISM="Grammatophora oceanica, Strain CCMP 410" /LENGTH=402 /DNA_ID=CAMNT_0038692451 /DNA_START=78 /DNA_END=1286 /DNA_ORIENTATION=+